MMGCDGVWDVMSPEEAVFELEGMTDPQEMAQKLVICPPFRPILSMPASVFLSRRVSAFVRVSKCCCRQVELSLDKGTTDNTTALIIRFNDN
jgi:serine/threonine protein phosphatase PrpC